MKTTTLWKSCLMACLLSLGAIAICGCGGGGGESAQGVDAANNLRLQIELPRSAGAPTGYTANIRIRSYDATGTPTDLASSSTTLTYNSTTGKYEGSYFIQMPKGGSNYICSVEALSGGSPFAYAGALIDSAQIEGTTDLPITATTTVEALSALNYAISTGVPLSDTTTVHSGAKYSLGNAVSSLVSASSINPSSFVNYAGGDPFVPSNWNAAISTDLNTILTTARASTTCGNSTLEIDEMCEDGNPYSWDGCSTACQEDISTGATLQSDYYDVMFAYTTAGYNVFTRQKQCTGSTSSATCDLTYTAGSTTLGSNETNTYTIDAEGRYQVSGHTGYGVIAPNGSVYAWVDTDNTDNALSLVIGVRKGANLSTASLNGTYDFHQIGYGSGVYTMGMTMQFDGQGTESWTINSISGGSPSATTGIGSYSVTSDGVFTTYTGKTGMVSADHNFIIIADTDSAGGISISLGVKRSSGLSNTSLKGRYYRMMMGSGPFSLMARLDADGSGNAVNEMQENSFTNVVTPQNYTYSINSDGTGTITSLTSGTRPIILSPDGYLMLGTDTDSSDGTVSLDIGILGITAITTCGNSIQEGAEQCDDGNTVTEICTYGQPSCTVCDLSCQSVAGAASYCGDSVVDNTNSEQCDDGNTTNGDGCSSTCSSESGTTTYTTGTAQITLDMNQGNPRTTMSTAPSEVQTAIAISGYYGVDGTQFAPVTSSTTISPPQASFTVNNVPIGVNHLTTITINWSDGYNQIFKCLISEILAATVTNVTCDERSSVIADSSVQLAANTNTILPNISTSNIQSIGNSVDSLYFQGVPYNQMSAAMVLTNAGL